MKLKSEFYRLPFRFDTTRLKEEVLSIDDDAWLPHPTDYKGNTSIPLITVNGELNDLFNGPMKPTAFLEQCPYIKQVIASLGEVVGRSRLMRLGAGCDVHEHSDLHHHWYTRVRIHVPIITYPDVRFYCGDKSVHMGEGEMWIFDSWKLHRVTNPTENDRTHLVFDTAGSSRFWSIIENSDEPHNSIIRSGESSQLVPFREDIDPEIITEQFNVRAVMSPGEVDALCFDLITDVTNNLDNNPVDIHRYARSLENFSKDWRATWLRYGETKEGWPAYQQLITIAQNELGKMPNLLTHSNQCRAIPVFYQRVLVACFNPDIVSS